MVVCNASNTSTTVTLEPCSDKFNDSTVFSFRNVIRIHSNVLGELNFCSKELALVAFLVLKVSPAVFNTEKLGIVLQNILEGQYP